MLRRLGVCAVLSMVAVGCGASDPQTEDNDLGTRTVDSMILQLRASTDRTHLVLKGALTDKAYAGRYPNLDRVDEMTVKVEPDGTIRAKCLTKGVSATCIDTPFLLKAKTVGKQVRTTLFDVLGKQVGGRTAYVAKAPAGQNGLPGTADRATPEGSGSPSSSDDSSSGTDDRDIGSSADQGASDTPSTQASGSGGTAPAGNPGGSSRNGTSAEDVDRWAFCSQVNDNLARQNINYRIDCTRLSDNVETIGGEGLVVEAPSEEAASGGQPATSAGGTPSGSDRDQNPSTDTGESAGSAGDSTPAPNPACDETTIKDKLCQSVNTALARNGIRQTIDCTKLGNVMNAMGLGGLVVGSASNAAIRCTALTAPFVFQGPPADCRNVWWNYQGWVNEVRSSLESARACQPEPTPPPSQPVATGGNGGTAGGNGGGNAGGRGGQPRCVDVFMTQGNNWGSDTSFSLGNAGGCRIEPLVLDLDGNGIQLTSMSNGANFDLLATGDAVRTAWTDGKDAFLVMDRNANGRIDDATELFGDLTDGKHYENGFAALAEIDGNNDGQIDERDGAYRKLRLWTDSNRDGISTPDELVSLSDAGIAALSLNASSAPASSIFDRHGNQIPDVSHYVRKDGSKGMFADVYFRFKSL